MKKKTLTGIKNFNLHDLPVIGVWISFVRLMFLIFGKNDHPSLEKIQSFGLLFVKIAQMYALRVDFLTPEKCKHLTQLYRFNKPIPTEDFFEMFQVKAPEKLKTDLEIMEKTPLATASVGQVHRAKLKNGQDIVVKIIKSDFKRSFVKDVANLRKFVKLILFFYPKLERVADPLGTLAQIEYDTVTELNLLNEIKGACLLKNFRDEHSKKFDLKNVDFPVFYEEYSNEEVLVSNFIEGQTFDELLSRGKLDYETMLELFKIHGFYMFLIGKFHGDIHPANIILHNKNLIFIDTSNVSEVKKEFGLNLLSFFNFLGLHDYKKCAEKLYLMSEKKVSPNKYAEYERKFIDLYKDFGGKTVSEISLTKQMMETVKMAVLNGLKFEKGLFSIIKSLMYLDGMVLKSNPAAHLLEDMQKQIANYRKNFQEIDSFFR